MSNKSPYEIRADILQLAKSYMDQQVQLNATYMSKLMDNMSIMPSDMSTTDVEKYFKMYTPAELVEKATEFYSFVTKKE